MTFLPKFLINLVKYNLQVKQKQASSLFFKSWSQLGIGHVRKKHPSYFASHTTVHTISYFDRWPASRQMHVCVYTWSHHCLMQERHLTPPPHQPHNISYNGCRLIYYLHPPINGDCPVNLNFLVLSFHLDFQYQKDIAHDVDVRTVLIISKLLSLWNLKNNYRP